MNVADSDSMALHLTRIGMLSTDKRDEADIIVLNTCTVRKQAELKAFTFIGWLKPLKEKNPQLKIVVAGCAAQRLGKKIQKKFAFVDLVVGANDVDKFPDIINAAFGYSGETVSHTFFPLSAQSLVSAFVTIIRGCDNFCSYCIVPHVRGRENSRPVADIMAEVRALAQRGVRDVTLLGQNVNSYAGTGRDGTVTDFSDLLRAVSTVEGIRRIRFTTNHPKDLSDKLIQIMATTDTICKHVHLPLQSGSDRILNEMNRKYTAADYSRLVSKLRAAVPDISLTTDIMVGFPGETEEDFQETVRLVEATGFNSLFAYKYSPREGTASFGLKDDIPPETKEERLDMILALANRISKQKNAGFIDTLQDVLVEKKEGRFCTSRTDTNTKVYFFTDDPDLAIGQFVQVKITECRITTLVGDVTEKK